jgi:hypothetical protein
MQLRWGLACLAACGGDSDLAGGVIASDVTLFQGPQISLIAGGELVTSRVTPVIANRRGTVRVTLNSPQGAEAREVTVIVSFIDPVTLASEVVSRPITLVEGAQLATIDLPFPDGAIAPNSSFVVSVFEQPGFSARDDVFDGARQPAEGMFPLDARVVAPFEVVVLPTGRTPPLLDDARQERWRAALAAQLPVSAVNLRVATPLVIDRDMSQNANWPLLLGDLAAWRAREGLAPQTFVIGALSAQTGTGIGGIAASLAVEVEYWRVAAMQINELFPLEETGIVVHELGHSLGRSHAPCGDPGGPDFAYPYQDGLIGVPGIDQRDGRMRLPTEYYDVMTYCQPVFISDYGYTQLYRGLSSLGERTSGTGDPGFVIDPVWFPAEER